MSKELLFSITAKDCEWSYTRGSGKGGQKKNKTSSAVHCIHRESGAHGFSEESRSQRDNRTTAFLKMINTPKFKTWHKLKCAQIMGIEQDIKETVDRLMNERYIKTERKENGVWVVCEPGELLNE